ncbi:MULTISPECIES: hypothetical protein [Pseudonocardia]|uniref:DoxX n=2 Tax=Pseudonocardia TaxID=1847 RepID=A0A1Y2MY53_PSEAH|nr:MULTISPECIES: hypothetical protein [Pseudonocardia]OSY39909.1 hypothetical protein BG845_03144 [Pseudonocardia autotrophica]TDN74505.1 hypothetical protein C8E95_3628 [Pseudonocardia autotrophica]BBG05273.1 hypothetical protein Pdca_64820 [Pseudonocardia autotrophica]GEC28857.1 hypothetical protein PSA01_58860 [Pseudonocardia saturnea]
MLWFLHGLLRFLLIVWMIPYAWSKLNLTQMGQLDYSAALTTIGEKSPMGLLWTFMAYSPLIQFLAGLAELVVMLLLVFRRTAWLGGVLGTAALGTVFLLNMTFDVPVKQPALILTIGFLLVAVPELGRVLRFVAGRPVAGTDGVPRLLPWPRVRAVTRWLSPVLGVLVVLLGGVLFWQVQPPRVGSELALPGVYRVVEDPAPPVARLADDTRWQSVAFGQWVYDGPEVPIPSFPVPGEAGLSIRAANGDLVVGNYRPVRDGVVELTLREVTSGAQSMFGEVDRTVELSWEVRPDGRVALRGDGQDLLLESDPELRFLYDRGFSWNVGNEAAVNR